MRSQPPAASAGRSRPSAIRQQRQMSGPWAILSETSSLKGRLWLSWPGLAPLLPVRGRRLGRCARRLLRPLQPKHQLDQLRLAQALKLVPLHARIESANSLPRKGGWVITNRQRRLLPDAFKLEAVAAIRGGRSALAVPAKKIAMRLAKELKEAA